MCSGTDIAEIRSVFGFTSGSVAHVTVAERPQPPAIRRRQGTLFSLGKLINGRWAVARPMAPWVLSASALAVLGSWDFLVGGGRVDAVVMGLAAYELLIGLTEEPV